MRVSSPESFDYLVNWAALEIGKGNNEDVRKRLEVNLKKYNSGTRQYSILASIMAFMYHTMGRDDEYKRYLSQTVISDIKGAVKENVAIRELATQVFEDGEIDRANHYLKVSFDDANFYAARMRNAQSSRMLPVIDKAYDTRQKELQSRQRVLIYITSGLLILVAGAVFFILKQVKRIILKKLDEGDVSADYLRIFYTKFDEAILNIYPSYIEKVNQLLTPDNQIVLKSGEKLNTELRIIALIRLGITDSEKISQFLRCSISTIYTYRSKLKRRAMHPDEFENEILAI